MMKTFLATAVALFLTAGAADAATLDLTLGSTYGYASATGSVLGNIDLSTAATGGSLALSGSADIRAAGYSVSGISTSPSGTLYGDEYVNVQSASGTSAVYSLTSKSNTFSFTWGTIDTYNTLIVKDTAGNSFSITGTDILNHIVAPDSGTSQSDVAIHDPFGDIISVTFLSSSNSFEAANFFVSAVPLSPSVVFFGLALAGLAFYSYRRRSLGNFA